MTIARPRSRFSLGLPRIVSRVRRAPTATLIAVTRTAAGALLIGAIAASSRLMYSLSWQADGGIALLVAAGWMFFSELLTGGL